MATKKSYSRHFIILQEEEKGYALASDKLPSGYAKIEIKNDKCRITYYVQNLKKEMCPYHMILICNKKDIKKIINLGELNIDDYGRTEVTYEYNSEDLYGSGVGIEKVVGAAVAKISEANLTPIMLGFITTDNQGDWKRFPMFVKKEEVKDIDPEESILMQAGIPKTEIGEEPILEVIEPKKDVFEARVEEVYNIEVKTEPEPEFEPQIQNIFENYEKGIEDAKIDAEINLQGEGNNTSYPVGPLGDYFRQVADGFEEQRDIFIDIKRCKWYKIPVVQESDYYNVSNYDKYSIVYYPMYGYFNYIKKYKHFLMGYKCDSVGNLKYIVYGIPGKKNKEDQPFDGKTGFASWWQVNRAEDSEGYWLMFYDFKNRTIVVPIRA